MFAILTGQGSGVPLLYLHMLLHCPWCDTGDNLWLQSCSTGCDTCNGSQNQKGESSRAEWLPGDCLGYLSHLFRGCNYLHCQLHHGGWNEQFHCCHKSQLLHWGHCNHCTGFCSQGNQVTYFFLFCFSFSIKVLCIVDALHFVLQHCTYGLLCSVCRWWVCTKILLERMCSLKPDQGVKLMWNVFKWECYIWRIEYHKYVKSVRSFIEPFMSYMQSP